MATNILLIDLSSIAHPLFHVSASDPDPNATSIKTVARVRALASGQPHVAVCCDSGRSFRKDISADYKANRPASDATLQHQITLAMETLKADGFPVWAVKGFEADDLLASATLALCVRSGHPPCDHTVTIASSDKDLLQLISDRVTVKKLTDGSEWTATTVQEKLGVAPNQVRDYLCLVGDASDNIKGAKGIGAKTAAALLTKYGTIEDMFVALDKHGTQFTPATATSLREFQPRLEDVRALVSLRTDVLLPFEEVFRERVPVDVAVFDQEDNVTLMEAQDAAENMGGSGTSRDRFAVDGTEPAGTDHGRPALVAGGESGASGRSDERASVDSGRVGALGPQPAAPNPAHRSEQRQSPAVETAATLTAREAELLPPPSTQFELQLEPRSLREAALLAQEMFKSRLFSAYGTYQGVLSTVLAGRELGLQAMASLRAFHIIDGKPTLSADLIRALVLKSGHAEYFRCTERTPMQASFVTKRKGDPEVSLTFTVAEGRQAWPKDEASFLKSGWGKNPSDMCVARASAKLARLVYADVVFNLYSSEEFD